MLVATSGSLGSGGRHSSSAAGGVRAERGLDRAGDQGRDPRRSDRDAAAVAFGAPVVDQVRLAVAPLERALPAGFRQHGSGDDDSGPARGRPRRTAPARRRQSLSAAGGPSSRNARICEVGSSTPCSRLASSPQPLGLRQRVEALEQPLLDEADLRLRERRVEPDASHRDPVPTGDFEHVSFRAARVR